MKLKNIKYNLTRLADSLNISHYDELIIDEDKQKIMLRANQLLNDIFVFDNNWDMEPSSKEHKLYNYNFEMMMDDDPEWCYMLNRFEWINYLILAKELSSDNKYLYKAKKYILSWINKNPQITAKRSTRTLDTGIRISSFIQAMIYLYKYRIIADDELNLIKSSLTKQCEYLRGNYISRYTLSNWGIIQLCGILEVYPIIDIHYEKNDIYNWAIKELIQGLRLQILPDGIDWERSPMYQGEILLSILKVISKYKMLEIPGNSELEKNAHTIANGLRNIITSSGMLECFGDSDRIQTNDLFEIYSIIFKRNKPNFCQNKYINYDTLYFLGSSAQKIYNNLQIANLNEKYFDGKYSGIYTIRDSYDLNSNFLLFNNGSLSNGHIHCDNLHFIISIHKIPFIVDSGRYSYRENESLRTILKSMKMHNSVVIDDNEYCKASSSWNFSNFGTPLPIYSNHLKGLHYLEGTMLGNNPLQVWTRKVIVIGHGIYIIVDNVKEDGIHRMDTYFHLNNLLKIKKYSNEIVCKLNDFTYKIIRDNSGYSCTQEVASYRYNELNKQNVLKFTDDFENKVAKMTIIVPNECRVKKVYVVNDCGINSYDKLVDAWSFEYNDKKWDLAVVHDEMYKGKNLMFLNGTPFHAHAIVVDSTDELQKKSYILKA